MSISRETMRISLKDSPTRLKCILVISKEMTCMSRERVSYTIDVHPADQHARDLLENGSDNTSSFTLGTTREYPEKHNNGEGEGEKETNGE
ncbi:hypothetical protein ACE6H2_010770 [Prunus campanulata]